MKIKVCGLLEPGNIRSVAALEPDYMGFIFYNGSQRFAGNLRAQDLEEIPVAINKTAVFVDENVETISAVIDKYNFDFIQLHGSEAPAFCKILKDRAIVIKAFGIDSGFDFSMLEKYRNKADLFLFDTKTAQHGGSGKVFNWDIVEKYEMDIPFFLSGGLSLDNLEQVKNIKHPQFYGVDLNSRFETSPGLKNIEKLEKAFKIIKTVHTDEVRS